MTIRRSLDQVALHFVTPVWGREFTQTFLEVMLPSLLAPGNLPAIPNKEQCVYKIFTLENDAQTIKGSSAFAALASLMTVEVNIIQEPKENKYYRASDCYRESSRQASLAQAAVAMFGPDVVVADGSVDAMVRLLRNGKRAILVMGVRTIKESIIPELLSRYAEDGCLRVPKRQLAKLALDHLHPITESHMFDGDSPRYHASGLFWRVGDEGLLLHAFHLHPIVVHAPTFPGDFEGTIDNDLMEKSNLPDEAVHIVADSDEFLCFEMSSRDYSFDTPDRGGMLSLVSSVQYSTSRFHRKVVRVPIRVHAGKTTESKWSQTERRAQYVISRILDACDESAYLAAWSRGELKNLPLLTRFRFGIQAIEDGAVDVKKYFHARPRVRAKAFLAFLIITGFGIWSSIRLPAPGWLKWLSNRADMYLKAKGFSTQVYSCYALRTIAAVFVVTARQLRTSMGFSARDPSRRP